MQVPAEFIQDCSDQCISHARDISYLIKKVLKVEPNHVFRDPWFGLCIWDSTSAMLTSSQWQESNAAYTEELTELIKLNLKAIRNTMPVMALAAKIVSSTGMKDDEKAADIS